MLIWGSYSFCILSVSEKGDTQMKKILVSMIVAMMVLVGCGSKGTADSGIKVYTRDGASGTREAFSNIIGLETMSVGAAETTSNGDMAKQVGATANGIGYVSLSTELEINNLRALAYEGVTPSVDSVNDGSYKLARPFSFVTRSAGDYDSDRKEALITALLDYMLLSTEGMEVILGAGGIVDTSKGVAWSTLAANHPIIKEDNSDIIIKTGGSTSVSKTLDAVVAAFIPVAGNFKYEPNHTGSSDGYKRVLGDDKDGVNAVDIGFASREFKSEEDVSKGMRNGSYCLDAVVVVTNIKNDNLSDANAQTLVDIFSGTKTTWK